MIEWVDKYSNVIQIIIGLLSLGATILEYIGYKNDMNRK